MKVLHRHHSDKGAKSGRVSRRPLCFLFYLTNKKRVLAEQEWTELLISIIDSLVLLGLRRRRTGEMAEDSVALADDAGRAFVAARPIIIRDYFVWKL